MYQIKRDILQYFKDKSLEKKSGTKYYRKLSTKLRIFFGAKNIRMIWIRVITDTNLTLQGHQALL